MSQPKPFQGCRWRFTLVITLATLLTQKLAVAQITPDDTLGNEPSRLTRDVTIRNGVGDRIDGGAVRGTNLFHSFQEFNVGEGQRVYFGNPTGIQNILTRITGVNASNLLGTLGVEGGANLFLLNPNGIVFGPNARLDVGASFVGTTAAGIQFDTQGVFSAASDVPLLTVNPSALFFNQTNTGAITSRARLSVPEGQTLALVGGTVTLNGSSLSALGGRVELGAVRSGTVSLGRDLLTLNVPATTLRTDIAISNGSRLEVRAGNGGSLALNGNNITISGNSQLNAGIAANQGSANSQAGDILVNAAGIVRLTGQSRLSNGVFSGSVGTGGRIQVNANSLQVNEGAKVNVSTFGRGSAGDVVINVRDRVSFDGFVLDAGGQPDVSGSTSYVDRAAIGRGGDIRITADSVAVTNAASLATFSFGRGDAGNIEINASGPVSFDGAIPQNRSSSAISFIFDSARGQGGGLTISASSIALTNGAELLTFTFGNNNAGQISLNARDRIVIDGISFARQTPSVVRSEINGNRGQSGNVQLSADSIAVTNGGQINASTSGEGNAGNIVLNARDRVLIEGATQNQNRAVLRSEIAAGVRPNARGEGGNVQISTRALLIRAGGRIDASSEGIGNAGNVIISARDRVILDGFSVPGLRRGELFNSSGISSVVTREGQGGNIQISTDVLSVTDGAQLIAGTVGRGDVGNIILSARSIVFDGTLPQSQGSTIATVSVFPGGQGQGGDLRIRTDSLSLTNGALLFANTFNQGNAGSIFIDADRILIDGMGADGRIPSGILATVEEAATGRGGGVRINVADSLTITNGARISAETKGDGNAGDIVINAQNGSVLFRGRGRSSLTGLFVGTLSTARGQGGDITIRADGLQIENGATVSTLTRNRNPGGTVEISANTISQTQGGQILTTTSGSGRAGNIRLSARDRITLSGSDPVSISSAESRDSEYLLERSAASGLFSNTLSRSAGRGGNMEITSGRIVLRQGAEITAASRGTGDSGNLIMTAGQMVLKDARILAETVSSQSGNIIIQNLDRLQLTNSQISASTQRGRGGSISLNRSASARSIQLNDGSRITTEASGTGDAGSLDFNTNRLTIQGRASSISAVSQSGRGGDIKIDAAELIVRDRGSIAASTVSGQGGDIQLRELDTLLVDGGTLSASGTTSQSQAGALSISARQVQLINGGRVTASTQNGQGGRITLGSDRSPAESVQISGNSQLITEARGSGDAGNLSLNTRQLTVQGQGSAISASSRSGRARSIDIDTEQIRLEEGARVSASTRSGQAGNLQINAAGSIQLRDRSRISVEANEGGTAGNLSLTTQQLTVQGGSQVTVRSPEGEAGNLTASADAVVLNSGELSATTGVSRGKAGANIILNDLDLLLMRNGSQIQANAALFATGGNININSEFIVAPPFDNSDITANAGVGDGGEVVINTQGVFGISAQPQLSLQSDITATSDQGVQGVVTINRPNVDPSRGLAELPAEPTDVSNRIDRSCPNRATSADASGEFVVSGRGGLPANPGNPLIDVSPPDWVSLDTGSSDASSIDMPENAAPIAAASPTVVEAQRWQVDALGNIQLLASASNPSIQTGPIQTGPTQTGPIQTRPTDCP